LDICERLSNVQAVRVASLPSDPSSTRAGWGVACGRVVVDIGRVVVDIGRVVVDIGRVVLGAAVVVSPAHEAPDESGAHARVDFPAALVATPAVLAASAKATTATAIPSAFPRERRVTISKTLGEPRCLQQHFSAFYCHE
jgi:hypothetical protein